MSIPNPYSGIPPFANQVEGQDPFEIKVQKIGGIPVVYDNEDVRLASTGSDGEAVFQLDPPAVYVYKNDIWNLLGQPADGTGSSFDFATWVESVEGEIDNKPVAPAGFVFIIKSGSILARADEYTNFNSDLGTRAISIQPTSGHTPGFESIIIGPNTNGSTVSHSIVIGGGNNAAESASVIGNGNYIYGKNGVTLGNGNTNAGDFAITLGKNNNVSLGSSSVIGNNNQSSGFDSGAVVIGNNNQANGAGVSIGLKNTGLNSTVVVGILNNGYNNDAVFGSTNNAIGNANVMIGHDNRANSSLTVGMRNVAEAPSGSAIGMDNNVSYFDVGIGRSNFAGGQDTLAIGIKNQTNQTNNVAIGINNTSSTTPFITTVGIGNVATALSSSLFGAGNRAAGQGSSQLFGLRNVGSGSNVIAIGINNFVTGSGSGVYGANIRNTVNYAQEIGTWATQTTRNAGVRLNSTGDVSFTVVKSDTAKIDGGATAGSEANGTLMRSGLSFRVSNTGELIAEFNDGGTIKTITVGTFA